VTEKINCQLFVDYNNENVQLQDTPLSPVMVVSVL